MYVESQGWKGPQESSGLTPSTNAELLLLNDPYPMLIQPPVENYREGDSMGSLFHCFTLLLERIFFLTSSLSLLCCSLKPLHCILPFVARENSCSFFFFLAAFQVFKYYYHVVPWARDRNYTYWYK